MFPPQPQSNYRFQSLRIHGQTIRFFFRFLFALLILSAFYDKSGIVLGETSVSFYKLILIALIAFYAVDCLVRPVRRQIAINKKLYLMLFIFVAIQTLASLYGNLVTNLPISIPSEIYYFLQRANFLLIPLFAVRYRISPRFVLKLFMTGVLIHYAFIFLQFISPGSYEAFSSMVSDSIRVDTTIGWAGDTIDFIGLQRTSNYGVFVAAFGLLALGFSPKRLIGRSFQLVVAGLAIFFVTLGPSRSALIMVIVTLTIYAYCTGWLSRLSTYFKLALLVPVAASLLLAGALPTERLASYNAFFDPERTGSNQGKLFIAELGIQLFVQSPIVGYGQRSFADLTLPLDNTNPFTSFTHSYGLSTLLSTGLIGLAAYAILWIMIVRLLMRKHERDYAIICGLFIGLGIYNIVYDAGGLDVFACFNGLAAYYALCAVGLARPIQGLASKLVSTPASTLETPHA